MVDFLPVHVDAEVVVVVVVEIESLHCVATCAASVADDDVVDTDSPCRWPKLDCENCAARDDVDCCAACDDAATGDNGANCVPRVLGVNEKPAKLYTAASVRCIPCICLGVQRRTASASADPGFAAGTPT